MILTVLVLDLDVVDEPELDEIEAKFGVDHLSERVVDLID